MALTDKDSKRKGMILIAGLLFFILIISFLVGGFQGIFAIIRTFFIILFVVAFLGAIFYVVYYLFFKQHRIDIPYENKKDFVNSAKENGPDMMTDLVLTGDTHHSSKRFMTITGYLRIKAFDGKPYDMFIGKKSGFPMNMFEDDKLVMLEPKEHSDLIGDVYVYGISLLQVYGYYFLNTKMQDYRGVDEFVAKDTFRKSLHYLLGDMKGLIDRSTGLDPDYAKERQREKLLKIPILSGQEQQK